MFAKQEPGRASQKHLATAYMPSFCSVLRKYSGRVAAALFHFTLRRFHSAHDVLQPALFGLFRSGVGVPGPHASFFLTVLPLIPPALRLHIDDSLRAPSCPFIQESSNEAKRLCPPRFTNYRNSLA